MHDGVASFSFVVKINITNSSNNNKQHSSNRNITVDPYVILTATTLIKLIYRTTTNYLIYNFHGHRKALWGNKISLHLHCCVISVVVDSVIIIIINDGWYQTACVEYICTITKPTYKWQKYKIKASTMIIKMN